MSQATYNQYAETYPGLRTTLFTFKSGGDQVQLESNRRNYSLDVLRDMASSAFLDVQYPFIYTHFTNTALNKVTYYENDHLGNLRVAFTPVVDCGSPAGTAPDPGLNHYTSSFTLDQVVDYFPYGKILRQYVNSEGPERYLTTQHERDQETGLDYRGARYYDSDVARFLSLDPVAAKYASWSPYNYVMGNPISLTDPSGDSTNYVDENGKPIANTNDGSTATVTISNEHLEAFKNEMAKMAVDKNSPSNNATWIRNYGLRTTDSGNNSAAQTTSESASSGGDGTSINPIIGPFLIFIGQRIIPKVGGVGGGGNAGGWTSIASTTLRDADSFIQECLGTSYKLSGKGLLFRLSGTRGVGATLGRAVPVAGWAATVWPLSYDLGKEYGPSKWYGEDDNKWFK